MRANLKYSLHEKKSSPGFSATNEARVHLLEHVLLLLSPELVLFCLSDAQVEVESKRLCVHEWPLPEHRRASSMPFWNIINPMP